MSTDFGKRLKLAREHAGLSQEALAIKVGMAQSTLAAAEASGHGSRVTPQIAHHCKVNCYWLATGEGEMLEPESWQSGTSSRPHAAEPQAPYITKAVVLDHLNRLLGTAAPSRRDALAALFSGWAKEGESPIYPGVVGQLLSDEASIEPEVRPDASSPPDAGLGGESQLGELGEPSTKPAASRRRSR